MCAKHLNSYYSLCIFIFLTKDILTSYILGVLKKLKDQTCQHTHLKKKWMCNDKQTNKNTHHRHSHHWIMW